MAAVGEVVAMLEPYRVLDLTNERGLSCGLILADLGADVIAVEPPDGSSARRLGPFAGDQRDVEQSLYWWAYSRNKRGVMLDLENNDSDRERFRDLVRTADVVIESFEPGYLDQIGLGYQQLSAINPGLVLVSITPFGQTGPKAHWAATDLTALASSGVLLITGDGDRPPVHVPGGQAALHAGGEAAVGALAALAARDRDGHGQHVDVSMQTAAMMATQSFILTDGWRGDPVTRIAGGVVAGPLRIRFVYPCKDGYVSVTFLFGNTIGPFTKRLFTLMHEEGFVDEATRDKDWVGYVPLVISGVEPVSEMERCTAAIERFTLSHSKVELTALAKERGLLIVPTNTTADLLASPQYNDRGYWTTADGAVADGSKMGAAISATDGGRGGAIYPGPFAKFSATPIRFRRPAPRIGEHNADILMSLHSGSATATGSAAAGTDTQHAQRAGEPPLAGLKVLDFTWVYAGPMGSRYFADLGATVVHIESSHYPDALRGYGPFKDALPGVERSANYHNACAGKLGLSLNLAQPGAREIALRLVAWADVVVENYSPRAMRKWGLHYDALCEVNPGLLMLSTCLNGQTGPENWLAGFGTMGAALSGFHELTGWPDRPPAGPFVAYTDYTSPKYIAAALLAALDHRRRTGQGQYIDLSQAEVGMQFLAPAFLDYTVNGRVDKRRGNASAEFAPHGVYPCKAGSPLDPRLGGKAESPTSNDRWAAIACTSEAQWQALCLATENPGWRDDPRFGSLDARLANHAALDELIARWTATREIDDIEQLLQAAGVPVHRATSSADMFTDLQIAARGHVAWVDHPELGSVPLETSRLRFSHTPPRPPTPGPAFGQHNEFVLRELLGMSDDEIVAVVVSGALD